MYFYMQKIMIRSLLTFLIHAMFILPLFAQTAQFASGVVYHDLNRNGYREKMEPGITNVAVSNGKEVVLTDSQGAYKIGIHDDTAIFVIKPGNYEYPLDERNFPKFYYLHKPGGSPQLKYAGVQPTGALPASLDFALVDGSDSDEFSMLVLSDPQTYSVEEIEFYCKSAVEELKMLNGHAFGITLGDIVGDHPDFFEGINQATSQIGIPWFHSIGNHDENYDAREIRFADESFERHYGPSTYSFNQGKVHIIVLDDVIYPNNLTKSWYAGGLTEDQFSFVENDLRFVPKDHLVLLMMHIPFYNGGDLGENFLVEHRARLFELLADRPFTLSVSGHMHAQLHYFFDASHGWQQEKPHHHYTVGTTSGDWWSGELRKNGVPETTMYDGTPQGYNILRFNGNQYTYDYRVFGESEDYKMRVYGPKVVPFKKHYRGEFYVNFFQGSKNDVAEYSVNDGEWKKMRYVIDYDPYMCAIRQKWDASEELLSGVHPSNPVMCHHLWKARVPTDVLLGENVIRIRIKDMQGREFEDTYLYKAVE